MTFFLFLAVCGVIFVLCCIEQHLDEIRKILERGK